MGIVINLETNEILYESNDPSEVKAMGDELASKWKNTYPDKSIPYSIQGFSSEELESGISNNYTPPEPPPDDIDRLVINEEEYTVTVYGDAEAPADFGGTIINAD